MSVRLTISTGVLLLTVLHVPWLAGHDRRQGVRRHGRDAHGAHEGESSSVHALPPGSSWPCMCERRLGSVSPPACLPCRQLLSATFPHFRTLVRVLKLLCKVEGIDDVSSQQPLGRLWPCGACLSVSLTLSRAMPCRCTWAGWGVHAWACWSGTTSTPCSTTRTPPSSASAPGTPSTCSSG